MIQSDKWCDTVIFGLISQLYLCHIIRHYCASWWFYLHTIFSLLNWPSSMTLFLSYDPVLDVFSYKLVGCCFVIGWRKRTFSEPVEPFDVTSDVTVRHCKKCYDVTLISFGHVQWHFRPFLAVFKTTAWILVFFFKQSGFRGCLMGMLKICSKCSVF